MHSAWPLWMCGTTGSGSELLETEGLDSWVIKVSGGVSLVGEKNPVSEGQGLLFCFSA